MALNIKKNVVEIDIKKYMQLIIGDKKVGKTALTAEIAKEIYGGIDKLLIVSIGKEKAYEALHGVSYLEPQDWQELMEIVDDLVAEKDNLDFDFVSFDTIDEIIPMAEEEVVRLHTMAYKETPKSFNACFGGYGEPRKKLGVLIDELLSKLDELTPKIGVQLIGHNKVRSMKTKLDTEDYYIVSSNLSFDYFNMFAYKCPIICNIVKEVETVETGKKETIGKTKKDVMVAGNRGRMMYLRDSGAVEAGGRFAGMPEKVPYGAQNYYDALIVGIKAEIEKHGGTAVEKEIKKAPSKSTPKPEPKPEPTVAEQKPTRSLKDAIAEVIEEAKELTGKGVAQNDIMDVLAEAGFPNPKSIPTVEVADEIMAELNKLG